MPNFYAQIGIPNAIKVNATWRESSNLAISIPATDTTKRGCPLTNKTQLSIFTPPF